ncbi:MAG: YihA family ribosome biogenesis GTP-binding protein [Nitrospirae bacterium]|nr:YihA family ribosome biogenesis GTP-binding protein [Nitrospirota bacterium]
MKITSAVFIKSCTGEKDFPKENMPEIAFVGRSNVGKSSLINCLVLRKNLVKTSSTPGKTQVINFFKINNAFNFVDLPGYGYAKAPRETKEKWGPMIEGYLSNRKELKCVVFILDIRHLPTEGDKRMKDDIRHLPTEGDKRMKEWLEYYKLPVIYAATKADKVKQSEIKKQIEKIMESLELERESAVFPFSAKTKTGKDILWKKINGLLRST